MEQLLEPMYTFMFIVFGILALGFVLRVSTKPLKAFNAMFQQHIKSQSVTNHTTNQLISGLKTTTDNLKETTDNLAKFIDEARKRDQTQNQTLHELVAANKLSAIQCETHREESKRTKRRIDGLETRVGDIEKVVKVKKSIHAPEDN